MKNFVFFALASILIILALAGCNPDAGLTEVTEPTTATPASTSCTPTGETYTGPVALSGLYSSVPIPADQYLNLYEVEVNDQTITADQPATFFFVRDAEFQATLGSPGFSVINWLVGTDGIYRGKAVHPEDGSVLGFNAEVAPMPPNGINLKVFKAETCTEAYGAELGYLQ